MKKPLLWLSFIFGLAGAMLLLSTPAHATMTTSWFAYTPRCCNRAAIRTDVLNNGLTRIIGSRFEYFRLKNDGSCQHVKQTTGDARLPGYIHIPWQDGQDGRQRANGWLETSMNECCGSPVGTPLNHSQNCIIQVFHGSEPWTVAYFGLTPQTYSAMGFPNSVP